MTGTFPRPRNATNGCASCWGWSRSFSIRTFPAVGPQRLVLLHESRFYFFQLGERAKINAGTVWHRRFTSFGRLSSAQNLSFTGEHFPPGCAVSFVNRRFGVGWGLTGVAPHKIQQSSAVTLCDASICLRKDLVTTKVCFRDIVGCKTVGCSHFGCAI